MYHPHIQTKLVVQKDTCTPMFTEALFTIIKIWKPNCPSTDKWIKKIRYIYIREYYSAIKKTSCLCSNMDRPRDSQTKESKSEREKQISYDIMYM